MSFLNATRTKTAYHETVLTDPHKPRDMHEAMDVRTDSMIFRLRMIAIRLTSRSVM